MAGTKNETIGKYLTILSLLPNIFLLQAYTTARWTLNVSFYT